MILNWPEDIIHLRFGIGQLFISLIGVLLFKKIRRGNLVWICHNLTSHKKNTSVKTATRNFYIKKSDFIIVHSKEALRQLEKFSNKVTYIPHPAYHTSTTNEQTEAVLTTDVLIWGNILPYKGLGKFIDDYKQTGASFKVLIIGQGEKNYVNSLEATAEGLNIEIKNEFLSEEELYINFSNTKIILLPYSKNSTTSGALIHSLNSGKIVIGPAVGNFLDLHEVNACLIYDDFEDLLPLITKLLQDNSFYREKLSELQKGMENYKCCNTWDSFMGKLITTIE